MKGDGKSQDRRSELSLGWQIVLLIVCIHIGSRLCDAYGAKFADALNIEFFFGRSMIEIFFAAVVAIVGVLVCRAARTVLGK